MALPRALRSWLAPSSDSQQRRRRLANGHRLGLEPLESRVVPSSLPAPDPIDPTRGQTNLLRVVQMMSDKQNLNAQDHFPVPYTVIVSAGAAAPTIKNWLAGAPLKLDADQSMATGQGGNDIQVEVNTDRYTNALGKPDWKLRLNVNRVGTAPFAQNLSVTIAFPWNAFDTNNETLPALPNIMMGFQTRLPGIPGQLSYINGLDGGNVPLTMQMVVTPHILAGTTHAFEWAIDTTGAANPLTFLAGEFDGNPASNTIVDALGWSAYVQNVPAHIGAELKVAENAIGSPAVDSKMDLHWTASARSLTTFDYLEAESNGAASSPQTADYATQIVADKMPTDERFVLRQDEAGGALTLAHDGNASIHEMTFLKRRSDGLSLTGVASDENSAVDAIPTHVAMTLGLKGYASLNVTPGSKADLFVQDTQVGGFNNTSQFFEKYNLEYVALKVKNSPNITVQFDETSTVVDGAERSFAVSVTNAGEVAPFTEMTLDDNGRISATHAPLNLELPERYGSSPSWNLWSIVDDGTHGTVVARALDITRKATGPFTGSALFDHKAKTIIERVEFQAVAAHPMQVYVKSGLLSAVQPPVPAGKTSPDPYIEITGHIEDVPIGHTFVAFDFPLKFQWKNDEGNRIGVLCMAGHIGTFNFATILEDVPSTGSSEFRPEGSIIVVAQDNFGNPDFFSLDAAIAYDVTGFDKNVIEWPENYSLNGFHSENKTFFPNSTPLKETRVRLDHVPSMRATWDNNSLHTYIDIATDAATGPFSFVGGVQLQISTVTALGGTVLTCDNVKDFLPPAATPQSEHYALLKDVAGEQTLKFGVFGVHSFHFASDDTTTPSSYVLDFLLDPSRPYTAAHINVDTHPTSTGALGTFFGGSTVTGPLDISYVPSHLNIASNFDPSFCTTGFPGLGSLATSDVNQNFTVNGTNIFVRVHDVAPQFCLTWNIVGATSTVSILSQNLDSSPAKTGYVQALFENPNGLPSGGALFNDNAHPLQELRIRLDDVPSLGALWTTGVDPQHVSIDTTAASGPFSILGAIRLAAESKPLIAPLPAATPFSLPNWSAFPALTGLENHYLRLKDADDDKLIDVGIFGVNSFDVKTSNSSSQTTLAFDGNVDRDFTAVIYSTPAGRFFSGHGVDAGLIVHQLPRNITLNFGALGKGLSYTASGGIGFIKLGGTEIVDPAFNPTSAETSGKYDDVLFDVLINGLPSNFSFAFDPAGSLDIVSGGAFVGDLTARLRSNTGVPSSDALFGAGVPVKDARLRLDHIPTIHATWSKTAFDFHTTANDVFLDGAQLAVSTKFNDLAALTPASLSSLHYVSIFDRDVSAENIKRLSVGAFGLQQVTYAADENTRFTTLHYHDNAPRLLAVTIDTKFGSRFFPAYDIAPVNGLTPTLLVDKVPALWDLRTNLATTFDYDAHGSSVNAIVLQAIVDNANDSIANGAIVDVSLPGHPATEADLPSRIYFELENGSVQIIDGKANMVNDPMNPSDDGIGAEDDGVFADIPVIDGGFDLNRDGVINGGDTGRLLGMTVKDGGIDVNFDGNVNGDDDGAFGEGANLKMNANIDSIHLRLESVDDSRGILGQPYRLIRFDALSIPGEWGLNWGSGHVFVEGRNAAGNPAPLGLVTGLISTSKDPGTNTTRLDPFRDAGPNQGGSILAGVAGGSRIDYSEFSQEIDHRYYVGSGVTADGSIPGTLFNRMRDLYAGGEILNLGEDHAVARFQGSSLQIASFQYTGFQKLAYLPNDNGGHYELQNPTPGLHPLFVGALRDDKAVTLQIENIPDSMILDIDTADTANKGIHFHSDDDANASVGQIDAYYGPLPMAHIGDTAARFVMNNTPSDVRITWNLGFPHGNAKFISNSTPDHPLSINFLGQKGGMRVVGGLSLQELELNYGIDFPILEPYIDVSFNPLDPHLFVSLDVFHAGVSLDNSADNAIGADGSKAGVSGFLELYQLLDDQGSDALQNLGPAGPAHGSAEFVPQFTFMMKDFKLFNFGVSAGIELFPSFLSPEVHLNPDPPQLVGQFMLDYWTGSNIDWTKDFDFEPIASFSIGFKNTADYVDNTPIHIAPYGGPEFRRLYSLVFTFDGFHDFSDHFDPFPPPPMLAAGPAPAAATGPALTNELLAPLWFEAAHRWAAAGATPDQVARALATTPTIRDLGGLYLGTTGGGQVSIDDNAAGYGWFVDPTPAANEEFGSTGNGAAAGRMDLLTVLSHEMGRQFGFDVVDAGQHEVMSLTLTPGTRLADGAPQLLATAIVSGVPAVSSPASVPQPTIATAVLSNAALFAPDLGWLAATAAGDTRTPIVARFDPEQEYPLPVGENSLFNAAPQSGIGGMLATYTQRPSGAASDEDFTPLWVG